MRFGVRRLVACLACIGAGFAISPVTTLGASSSSVEGVGASSSLSGALVTPSSPAQGEQTQAGEHAKLTSPEAVTAREASRTKYEGLNPGQAAKLAGEVFPDVIDRPAGTLQLPAGQQVVGYPADDVAQVDLGEGKRGVIESSGPIAVETSKGHREPLDLDLEEANGAFQPMRSDLAIEFPKQIGGGVGLASTGVSLTPVGANGVAVGGAEGAVDGATVLYANTQTDTDTVVKPLTSGFEEDAMLRSVESPEQLYYRVGLPAGASLVQAANGAGGAEVVKEGVMLAQIEAPGATDAAGTYVPVALNVVGDVIKLTVADFGEVEFPVEVDPTVKDGQLVEYPGDYIYSNWVEEPAPPSPFTFTESKESLSLTDSDKGTPYARGEWGTISYETQGASHIYELQTYTYASNAGANIENKFAVKSPGKGLEEQWVLGSSYASKYEDFCVLAGCATGKVEAANDNNAVEFKQTAMDNGTEFVSSISEARVGILQEAGPTITSVNTTSKTIAGPRGEELPNALYPGTWTGPKRGTIELTATDPGIGISGIGAQSPLNSKWWMAGGKTEADVCKGVQCAQNATGRLSNQYYEPLPSGEDTVELVAADAVGLKAEVTEKVKSDNTLPYSITLTGLPPNNELSDGEVKVKATAKDGTESFGGSGIESIALSVDGKAVGTPSGSCQPGPCTATSGEWTLNGGEYPAGKQTATVTATSYAGDVASEQFTFYTGHLATPVALGPGSVSPESGEFFLSSTDVSLGGPGASLSLTRSFGSSRLTAGAEGPLGPQWSMSVGGSQTLTQTPEGSVVLTNAEGQESVFTSKGKGEYTSPALSASLTLSEKSKVFYLEDGSGQVTKFTLPAGGTGNTWVPATLEGPDATDVTTYAFRTASGITEPTEVLAPVPAGVSCTAELVKGCRSLGFVYASKTTATGSGASEWGEYEGRLKEVTFTAWNPATSKMTTTAVAHYVYDHEGRLRGEWDPRISPALETTYGYNAAGYVTAMTSPGQQPWLFEYGTTTADPRTRILSVTRPAASTAAGSGIAPANEGAPALSTTAAYEDTKLSVTSGTWGNSPLAYEYQWEYCYTVESKLVCAPIPGATNQSYTPVGYLGDGLRVKVTATNSNGSTPATSNESAGIVRAGLYERKLEFGKEGTAEGQLKKPLGVAVDSKGNVFVADTGNNRIEEFSATGTFLKAYGKEGTGNVQFKEPKSIAVDKEGYMFIADAGNDRIEILNSKGEYVTSIKTTTAPGAIALGEGEYGRVKIDAIYVTFPSSNEVMKYVEYREERLEHRKSWKFGKAGSGNGEFDDPTGIALNEAGTLAYVTDAGNHRVQVLSVNTASEEELGEEVKYSAQFGANGTGNGQFSTPDGVAVEPNNLESLAESKNLGVTALSKDVVVADPGDSRVQQFSGSNVYQRQYSEKGAQDVAISYLKGAGNAGDMYVANSEKDKITKWVPGSLSVSPQEPPNPGTSAVTTVEYQVPVSGTGAPYAMGKTEVEAWGEKDDPVEATAILPPDEPMGWPAKDYTRATIYYLDDSFRTVNVASPGGAISTTEYNAKYDVERTLSPDNRAAALKEGAKSAETSKLLDTENTYNTEGTELQSTLGSQHNVELASGTKVEARDHKQYYYDEGAPSEGGPFGLPTKTTEGAEYSGKEEDIRETTMSYAGQENLGWKLRKPTSVTANAKGLKITHTMVYEASTGEVKETVTPAGNPKEKTAHGTENVYYTTAKNSAVPACGEHPEWADLPCRTQPAKQPETSGLPALPDTTITYNMWDEPEKTVEAVSGTPRTKTATYDGAGRLKTSSISSSVGTALPTVSDEYNTETGVLEKQSTTTEGKTKTITMAVNKLGETTSYTDADENTATYEYDIDGRTTKTNDGKGTQTYTYDLTTGDLTKLVDSAAGTFTASYDAEGHVLVEGYPNGMSANYTYSETGVPTSLEYVKMTHCTEKCTWFSDTVVPSIHGQWLEQTSTLSHQAYTYDAAGRLTEVQSTPSGEGCTTRIYAYEEDTNRTNLKTYEPGTTGKCATEKGIEEKHTYDSADRLTDTGTKYSEFGNITALPAADAGGTELTSAYYVDNQLQSQTQNGETIGYNLDPAGRTRETVSTGKTTQDIIDHYAGAGDAPAWTLETPSGDWTRNISGIGGLAAIQVNGATPVLQLTDLHGDIVATAALSETETKVLSTEDASEYGVPTTSSPAKYSWLGAEQQPTELASGVIAMGARSYVPQLGRFLQPDPIPGGSANAYVYTFGDPVNSSDPSGALTYGLSGWLRAQDNQEAKEVAEREVARETLEREEAERRAREAKEAEEAAAAAAAIPAAAEEPLGGYAGWACEYAAETGQEDSECGGGGGCSGDNACAAISAGGWACAIDGTLVALGVGLAAPSAGASLAVSAAASAALGLATTVACEYSPVHNIELSGLPRPSSDCFYVLTISKRTHERDHRTEECYA
jgi:RHS repeat-associated protein